MTPTNLNNFKEVVVGKSTQLINPNNKTLKRVIRKVQLICKRTKVGKQKY